MQCNWDDADEQRLTQAIVDAIPVKQEQVYEMNRRNPIAFEQEVSDQGADKLC